MTDLQIGLLVIGAAAVAGVLVYNRLQERATRRQAERAFGSQHADVFLAAPPERREPTLDLSAMPVREASPPVAKPASDPRIDYVVEVQGTSAGAIRPDWPALQRRFSRRATLTEGGGKSAHAALQMVSRNGVVSEGDLVEFRTQLETLGAAHGGEGSAPPPPRGAPQREWGARAPGSIPGPSRSRSPPHTAGRPRPRRCARRSPRR